MIPSKEIERIAEKYEAEYPFTGNTLRSALTELWDIAQAEQRKEDAEIANEESKKCSDFTTASIACKRIELSILGSMHGKN